jgi:hypothetical protein
MVVILNAIPALVNPCVSPALGSYMKRPSKKYAHLIPKTELRAARKV